MRGVLFSLLHSWRVAQVEVALPAAVTGWFSTMFYANQSLLTSIGTLLIFVMLDWITGVRASRYQGDPILSSKLGRTSDKAIGYVIGILALFFLGREIPGMDTYKLPACTALVCWFIGVESWSIFENLDRMGIKVPGFIKTRLRSAVGALNDSEKDK